MKKFIKNMIYRLMGDTRWDIIQETKNNSEAITQDLINLRDEISQFRDEFCSNIEKVYDGQRQLMDALSAIDGKLGGNQEGLRQEFSRLIEELHIHVDGSSRDILCELSMLEVPGNPLSTKKIFEVKTDYPVAYESADHLHPHGTKNDNTRAAFFIRKCEELFPEKKQLCFADLGCSGGGIVLDAVLRGHNAIGLEGSDYSLKHQRAEWRLLKNRLFTCDISKPFHIQNADGSDAKFDVVSAWEVLEHIPEDGVSQLAKNVTNMLFPGGYFVATVSQVEDFEPESGAQLHVTIRPPQWWYSKFEEVGLVRVTGAFSPYDMARAYGNPPLPWLLNWSPENSPYVVLRKP